MRTPRTRRVSPPGQRETPFFSERDLVVAVDQLGVFVLGRLRAAQPVPLQKVPEVEDRGFTGIRSSPSSIQAKRRMASLSDRSAHTSSAGSRPAASFPTASADGWPSAQPSVKRRDQRHQPCRSHDRIHLSQKQLPPRLLLLHRVAKTGKGGLFRHRFGIARIPCRDAQVYQIMPEAEGCSDVP